MMRYSVSYREREDSATTRELNFNNADEAAKAFVDLPAKLHPIVYEVEKSKFWLGKDSVKTLANTVGSGESKYFMPEKRVLSTESADKFSVAHWKYLGEKMRGDGVFSREEIAFMLNNPVKQGVDSFIAYKALQTAISDKAVGNSLHDQAITEIIKALGGKGGFAESFGKHYSNATAGSGLHYTAQLAREMNTNPLHGVTLKSDSIHGRIDELKQLGASTLQTLKSVSEYVSASRYSGVTLAGSGGGGLLSQVSAAMGAAGKAKDLAVDNPSSIDRQTLERDLQAIKTLVSEPISFSEISMSQGAVRGLRGELGKIDGEWSFSPSEGVRVGTDTVFTKINGFGSAGEIFDILMEGQKLGKGTMELSSTPMFYADNAASESGLTMKMKKGSDV